MHRFFLPPPECRGDALSLTGGEAHHALHVLRLRRGEMVIVLDGAGSELICEVRGSGRDAVQLAVSKRSSVPPPAGRITLLQAVPKGKTIETIIQKATELGASRVVPLLSERVAVRLDASAAVQKAEKWQGIAIEAIKQCGQPWLPKIEAPVTPEEFLARREVFDLALIASLQPGARHPREYFQAFRAEHGRWPGSLGVWVGPEGDFTNTEVAAAIGQGARPISLGPLVLRSETAALYCLSILNYELQSPL